MKISLKQWLRLSYKTPSIISAAVAVTLLGFSFTAQAGKITSIPSATVAPNAPGFTAEGFGGWNLVNNVDVVLTGTTSFFNEGDGSYFFDPVDSDFTYQANVDDGLGTLLGIVLAKDWPVG